MNKTFVVLDPATSLNNKTGSWRSICPKYVKRLPPCNVTCPAGENIQQWLSFAREGNFLKAWEIITNDNPFPAIMGRVCYHTCEKICNRTQLDGSVNINRIEKLIGDIAIANEWLFENSLSVSGKKVLIIGGGPSGLTAAYFLKKFGHDVTIYESNIKLGGMMRYGVPRHRLPNDILDAEIRRILNFGVKIFCSKKITDFEKEIQNFDAVYMATGAHMAIRPSIDIKKDANVIDAVDLFRKLEDDPSNVHKLGSEVIVYGGGNTAFDAARTVLRLGAKSVKIIYRRTVNHLSAHQVEIQDALAEGVEILCLRTINTVDSKKIIVNRMNYDEENDILSKTGKTEIIYANSVIFAVGQSVNDELFRGIKDIQISENGLIEIDKNMMSGVKGVFAGGDLVTGKRTVTNAIGYGKKAAKYINAYLRGIELIPNSKNIVTNFKKLNVSYYKNKSRIETSRSINYSFENQDIATFDNEIIAEASRCFSCGNCFHCDNCYGYCPDNAIKKHLDGTLEINYDYCKGCGICASECPCGAIEMIPEDENITI